MPRSKSHLVGRALAIERNREKKKNLDAISAIQRHLFNPKDIELNDEEEAILRRLKSIWFIECEGYPTKSIIQRHTALFDVSEGQAWVDLRHSRLVFGNPALANKAADAVVAGEMAKKLFRFAYLNEDYKGAAGALAAFIKAKGLDRVDPEMPDFSKLQIPKDEIRIPDDQMQILKQMITAHPVINISDFIDATDIESTPIVDDEEE